MKKRNNLDIILGIAAIGTILVVAGILLGRQSRNQNARDAETASEGPVVEVVDSGQEDTAETAQQQESAGALADGNQADPVREDQTKESKTAAKMPAGEDSQTGQDDRNDQENQEAEQEQEAAKQEAAVDTAQASETGTVSDGKGKAVAVTQKIAKKTKEQRDAQMAELYDYWSKKERDAVGDVIRLPRNVELSAELEGTDTFYYYGDTTAQGVPNGTGLAVYADNQFYFGGWLNGVRNGEGEWIKVYQYDAKTREAGRLYLEHTYFGQWAGDLPNGEGQEHFDIEASRIKSNDGSVQNVIGNFKDGLYDGEMYIIRLYEDGSVKEWEGTANYGVWNPLGKKNKKGEYPINIRKVDEDNYIWCKPADNIDFGVDGIIAAK